MSFGARMSTAASAALLAAAPTAQAQTAPAPAQVVSAARPPAGVTSVRLYGLIDVMAARLGGAATGVKSSDPATRRIDGGGFSTSFFGLSGAEDLGDGLEATFTIESFMRPDTGESGRSGPTGAPLNLSADPFFSRAAWVGLGTRALGRVRLGTDASPMWIAALSSNAFGDSTVFSPLLLAGFIGSPWTGGTSWTNGAYYDSPTIANVQARLAVSASEGQGGRNHGGYLRYVGGPLRGSISYQSVKKNPVTFADGASNNNTRTWLLSGSYDFNVVTVFAHFARIQNTGTEAAPVDLSFQVREVSASVPIGLGNLLVGYAERSTGAAVAPVARAAVAGNLGRRIATIGYDYFLSKRTDLYVVAMHDRTKTNNLNPPGAPVEVTASGNDFGFGIRHRF